MCLGNIHKKTEKKGVNATRGINGPHDYSHIFNEFETQLIIHRALLLHRLVQDPFYRIMNVSTRARMWMLRHLANLADHAEQRYRINLMQFFEIMGRDEMVKFLRYKNAPNEMIVLWKQMHPSNPRKNLKPRGGPAKRRRV